LADVFLSYAEQNRMDAQTIAAGLEQQGVSVWWDRDLETGEKYVQEIGNQLEGAACILVVWSRHALASKWVNFEAEEAIESDKLAQVRIESLRLPFPYRRLQYVDVLNADARQLSALIRQVASRVGKQPGEVAFGARLRSRPAQLTPASVGVGGTRWLLMFAPLVAIAAAFFAIAMAKPGAPIWGLLSQWS